MKDIQPMVLVIYQGKVLLRGWHLNGWSVSNKKVKKNMENIRTENTINDIYWFFYRLPPSYNMNDKGMRGGIITKADFNEIRRNQQALINQNKTKPR
jgi:hypothetical protein